MTNQIDQAGDDMGNDFAIPDEMKTTSEQDIAQLQKWLDDAEAREKGLETRNALAIRKIDLWLKTGGPISLEYLREVLTGEQQ